MKQWGRRVLLATTLAVMFGATSAAAPPPTAVMKLGDHTRDMSLSVEVCNQDGPQLQQFKSEHFHFQFTRAALRGMLSGGLRIRDYAKAFEQAWHVEIDQLGWAPPPPPKKPLYGKRYLVVVDAAQAPGLYGSASRIDTVGDNPATPWNDQDAQSSCIVINGGFNKVSFPGGAYAALLSTAAHEFHHAIQFGLGMLNKDRPDDIFIEATATWMEDEVFDSVNDNYNYLWPYLNDSMGEYTVSPYAYWIVFRALTERFGAGGEQVMQELAETFSRNTAANVHALAAVLAARGVDLKQAFHDAAIATSVLHACGGAYALPHCFEEADAYRKAAGPARTNGKVLRGETFTGTIANDLSVANLVLPSSGGAYGVRLTNAGKGGALRATVACDTGAGLRLVGFPAVLGAGQSGALGPVAIDGCKFVRLVITNETLAPGNPDRVPAPPYRVQLV